MTAFGPPRLAGPVWAVVVAMAFLNLVAPFRQVLFGQEPKFEHHAMPADLPLRDNGIGDYGQTAIADLRNKLLQQREHLSRAISRRVGERMSPPGQTSIRSRR
jgi:hypothetical protein